MKLLASSIFTFLVPVLFACLLLCPHCPLPVLNLVSWSDSVLSFCDVNHLYADLQTGNCPSRA